MGTISVTLPSDGETMDAADVNNPINTIVTLVNGNIDSDNVAAGGLTPANLTSGTGTSWAWQSWTPTWTNLTVGNGTVTATYSQVGKTVTARVRIVFGSTTSISGSVSVSLPVTATAYAANNVIGFGHIEDNGSTNYLCTVAQTSTTTMQPRPVGAAATYANANAATITSTAPMTWTTNDYLSLQVTYEAA